MSPLSHTHLILALLIPGTLAATPQKSAESRDWQVEAIMTTKAGINGAAVGDFDLSARNNEIAVACGNGNLYLIRQNGAREFPWRPEIVGSSRGELMGCEFAEVDPTRQGLELIAYGMLYGKRDTAGPGAVYMLSKFEGKLEFEELFHDTARIDGIAVGDFDSKREGVEILVAGASKKVHLLYLENDVWQPELMLEIGGEALSVAGYHNNALVGCADGSLLQLTRVGDNWKPIYLEQHSAAQMGVTSFQGSVLSAREDGTLHWRSQEGKQQTIYEGKAELRSAAMGQLDTETSGVEAVTGGLGGSLVVLYGSNRVRTWQTQVIHRDSVGFNHVTIGEVFGGNTGPEIVACGMSGQVYVASLGRRGGSAGK